MKTVSLRPITSDNLWECTRLSPTAEQQARGYVEPNVFSVAQAYVERWWIPLAIYADGSADGSADGTMVGFILYGRWPAGGYSHYWGDKPKPGIDYILRMMIDGRYQGQGYGTAALAALIARIKAEPGCRAIELDYDGENVAAARLYIGQGFQPIAEHADGEILARLDVDADTTPD